MFCREKHRVAARALISPDTSKDSSVTVASSTPPMMGMSDTYTFNKEDVHTQRCERTRFSRKLISIWGPWRKLYKTCKSRYIFFFDGGRRREGLMEELGCVPTQPPTLFLMQLWYSLNLRKGYIGDVSLHSHTHYILCCKDSWAFDRTAQHLWKAPSNSLKPRPVQQNQEVKVNKICLCWHTQHADTWFYRYLLLHNTAL